MKRIAIFTYFTAIIFANTAKVSFVNNTDGLTFDVVNNNNVLVRLNEYKQVSEIFVLPKTPKISVYLDGRLVVRKKFKFEEGSTNTLTVSYTHLTLPTR